jgi:hypothetical protein
LATMQALRHLHAIVAADAFILGLEHNSEVAPDLEWLGSLRLP